MIFYLNIGNIDNPYFRALELKVVSDNHILSTDFVLGVVLGGYDILKPVAALQQIKLG